MEDGEVPRGFLAKPRWRSSIIAAANREMHFVFLMMVAFVLYDGISKLLPSQTCGIMDQRVQPAA